MAADPQTYADWAGGELTIETSGQEDEMFSPFLPEPFEQAMEAGDIPADLTTIGGTWGAISDQGDLTYLNLVHLPNVDGTDEDVRGEGRIDDSIGIFPEFIDGYGILILPTTGRYFQVLYRAMLPKGVENLLVAGRSIGGDKVSHAAVRNMMCCAVSGQGAGVAASGRKVRTVRPRGCHRSHRTAPVGAVISLAARFVLGVEHRRWRHHCARRAVRCRLGHPVRITSRCDGLGCSARFAYRCQAAGAA